MSACNLGNRRLQVELGSFVSSTDLGRSTESRGGQLGTDMSSGVGQCCFITLHLSLPEIFNILLGLGLGLLYKLDMLI